MDIDTLRQRYETAKDHRRKTRRADAEAATAEREAELALLEAEDELATRLHRQWLRAWLLGKLDECDRLNALEYPEKHRQDTRRMVELEKELPAPCGVCGKVEVGARTDEGTRP